MAAAMSEGVGMGEDTEAAEEAEVEALEELEEEVVERKLLPYVRVAYPLHRAHLLLNAPCPPHASLFPLASPLRRDGGIIMCGLVACLTSPAPVSVGMRLYRRTRWTWTHLRRSPRRRRF